MPVCDYYLNVVHTIFSVGFKSKSTTWTIIKIFYNVFNKQARKIFQLKKRKILVILGFIWRKYKYNVLY